MRYLVLGGCGAVGADTVADLVATAAFERLTIVDIDPEKVAAAAARHATNRVTGVLADAADQAQLVPLLREHDIVVNCTPGHNNPAILGTAIETGTRYMDITGSMLVEERLALDQRAKDAGVLAVIAMGCSPGLTNAAAAHGVQHLDRTREIVMAPPRAEPRHRSRRYGSRVLGSFRQRGRFPPGWSDIVQAAAPRPPARNAG